MEKKIDSFISANFENIVRDIGRLVSINSVRGESADKAPYGEGPAKALALGLEIAEELGLNTRNCEGRMGYAQIGEGEDYLATITHLDVVPSPGWREDPFTLRRKEGWMIGRGVMDNKGPSVLCLYALKFIKDSGVSLRYPIRALLGLDEESGMSDLEYYLSNYPAPLFCFSPDSNFPLCNGEKGIFHAWVKSSISFENILDISGGVAANVVPDRAEALVKAGELSSTAKVNVEREGECWRLTAHGKGGHASLPEGTENAIGLLVDYILENLLLTKTERDFFLGLQRLHCDPYGKGINAQAKDEVFTPLTIVGGVISMEDKKIYQSIDSRYPTSSSGKELTRLLRENWGELAELEVLRDEKPFYMSLDNYAVQTCLDVYNRVTGEEARAQTMGGATYARHFPKAISFGPEHPERTMPSFAGPIHGVDEAASEEYFKEALRIYIHALLELEKLDY